jgi:hypothetical protein
MLAPFAKLVPGQFPNGLQLVERARESGQPWRTVDIQAEQQGAPACQEKISVADGMHAMYAFSGTRYFANTRIEFGIPGHHLISDVNTRIPGS